MKIRKKIISCRWSIEITETIFKSLEQNGIKEKKIQYFVNCVRIETCFIFIIHLIPMKVKIYLKTVQLKSSL